MSQDFTNIQEPPMAQETPDVSELNLQEDSQKPTPFIRRRSTNYIDALESQLRSKLGESQSERHRISGNNDTSTMNAQVIKHDMQRGSEDLGNSSRYDYKGVDLGYHLGSELSGGRRLPENEDNSKPHGQNLFYKSKSNPCGISFGKDEDIPIAPDTQATASMPSLQQRRPSVYEDYKKDVYERMHLFGK